MRIDAVAVNSYSLVEGTGCDNFIAEGIYINETNFFDPFRITTNLISELQADYPMDDPIIVPTVKKMKFKLGKSVLKELSL
jgi:hypothetical protein